MKNVGDRITVQADPVLGTEESEATIQTVHDWGYIVVCDDDPEQWAGPVDKDGRVLQEF